MTLPDWARAHGDSLAVASIRTTPEDFDVTEDLGYDCDGQGEHDFLYVEKVGTNTEWLARQLARHAGVAAKEVGYAGLKDRNAVTRQWFSVPRWHAPDWQGLKVEGATVLDVQRHSKKLRRGAHKTNRFRIVLRPTKGSEPFFQKGSDPFVERIQAIREKGVPNYYGEQRFGRNGSNLLLADDWAAGKRMPRHKRSLAISSARSILFNEYLQERVQDSTWNRIVPGDIANLDGTGSVFTVDEVDEDILRRSAALDLHPAGVLAGEGSAARNESWQQALDKARVKQGTRSLRLNVRDLRVTLDQDCIVLEFVLGRGAFATSVLREIVSCP